MSRVCVRMDITEGEAVRQLEGGKSVETYCGSMERSHFIILPFTNNENTRKWKFEVHEMFNGECGDLALSTSEAKDAVSFALDPEK